LGRRRTIRERFFPPFRFGFFLFFPSFEAASPTSLADCRFAFSLYLSLATVAVLELHLYLRHKAAMYHKIVSPAVLLTGSKTEGGLL
jgi:hypothetical protein